MQSERSIQDCIGIPEPGYTVKAISCKEGSSLFLASLVHERQLRPCRFDRLAPLLHIGQGLSAERSPEMAQEYQQDKGGSGDLCQASAPLVACSCQGLRKRLAGCDGDSAHFHSITLVVLP